MTELYCIKCRRSTSDVDAQFRSRCCRAWVVRLADTAVFRRFEGTIARNTWCLGCRTAEPLVDERFKSLCCGSWVVQKASRVNLSKDAPSHLRGRAGTAPSRRPPAASAPDWPTCSCGTFAVGRCAEC